MQRPRMRFSRGPGTDGSSAGGGRRLGKGEAGPGGAREGAGRTGKDAVGSLRRRLRRAMPRSRLRRRLLGSGLILGGILGFLPVLGFWMLPLGLAVLSVDSPRLRRLRRRATLRMGRSGAGRWLRRRLSP